VSPTRFRSIQLAIAGATLIVLLAWGIYSTTLVSTSPSGEGAIVDAVLNGESAAALYTGSGTIITPGSEGQFIVMFRSSVNGNAIVVPGTGTYLINGHEGLAFGPFLFLPESSNSSSSYHVQYALFSYLQCGGWNKGPIPPQGQPCPWFSGPQGNITRDTYDAPSRNLNPDQLVTAIYRIDSPGNYTLHYFNAQSTNATGKVIMGYSYVSFSVTRPYLYPGLATIGVAAAFLVATVVLQGRKRWEVTTPSTSKTRATPK
jgi:hypothetical protein